MRNQLAQIAAKPLRAIRSGRFPLSPVVARLSPRYGKVMASYRYEEEGRYDEALEAWSGLKGQHSSREGAFHHTLRSARLAHKAEHYGDAVKDFSVLYALSPGDVRVARGLEGAASHAARQAQSTGRWLDACRMWEIYGRVGTKPEKARRNLRECARYVAQSADTPEKTQAAIDAWGLLKLVDPDSREAQQGLEWCHVSLARAAERSGDKAAARKHWNALLELVPGDRRGLDGLERLDLTDA